MSTTTEVIITVKTESGETLRANLQVGDLSVLPEEGDLITVYGKRCCVQSRAFEVVGRKHSDECDSCRIAITTNEIK